MQEHTTLERITPDEFGSNDFDRQSLELHYERYRFAAKNASGNRILDIASGTGYGSYLLATEGNNNIREIVAVDISSEAIEYATNRYAHPKIKFLQQDALTFSDTELFSTIVSLETIEHVPHPEKFIQKLNDLLLPGGLLIASVPVTFSTDINPHHVSDFSAKSFRKLFKNFSLEEVDSLQQIQSINITGILKWKKNLRTNGIRRNILSYYLKHPSALFLRAQSFLTKGLVNKYLIVALRKKA